MSWEEMVACFHPREDFGTATGGDEGPGVLWGDTSSDEIRGDCSGLVWVLRQW